MLKKKDMEFRRRCRCPLCGYKGYASGTKTAQPDGRQTFVWVCRRCRTSHIENLSAELFCRAADK